MMDGKPIEVLLIEDNLDDVLLIRKRLAAARGARFILTVEPNLASGLERLARGGMDVLLLDLGLPDSRGMETVGKAMASVGRPASV